jgi:nitroreductase
MDAIKLLTTRQSCANLFSPAPTHEHLQIIMQAGNRAPDHGGLMPWHFTVVENDGLHKLSDLFVATAKAVQFDQQKLAKVEKMPFRAPLIIIVSTDYKNHEKVPKQEQLIAAGCCVHAMQMAAFALGYGAVWRTGEFSYNNQIKAGLAIESHNDIVGFLYIGSLAKTMPIKPSKALTNISYF